MALGRCVRSVFLTLLLVLFATSALADGRVVGRITRNDGTGIGGVIVQVIERSKAALSDSNGSFVLDGVPAGTYTVQFIAGSNVADEANVTVTDGNDTRIDKKVDWRISVAETITVYSASRRTERVVEAPAAVTVAAEEEIAAAAPSGQAPRIIESAPGVDFTQSGLYDFNFNTRGFNSSLNRRVLTLIDGRDPSVPFLGAQEWAALSLPLDEMASVELVRGPGSALYGANAFAGVLNMTTKQPRLSPGGRAILTVGDLSTRRADIRHAGALGGDWFYRVVGGWQESDDFTRSRNVTVEYTVPCTTAITQDCLPREARALALTEDKIKFGGLRFDKHMASGNVLTLEGGLAQLEGPTFQTGIGRVQVTDVSHPWGRINYNAPHWNALAYYDGRIAEDQVALASGASLWEDSHNLHAELQTNWGFNQDKSRIVLGGAYKHQEVDTANPQGVQTLMLEAKEENVQSAFGQLEHEFGTKVKFVGAARYDDSTFHEAQFSPKAALVFTPTPNHTLRYGYNRAFQRPNYSELFLAAPAGAPANLAGAATLNPQTAPLAPALTALGFGPLPILARGNANLDVEKVQSHEIGYAGIYGGKLYLTADYYRSKLSDFVTDLLPGVNPEFVPYTVPTNIPTIPAPVQAGLNAFLNAALGARRGGLTTVNGRPALVFSYANAGEVDTQGVELAANYYVTNTWVMDVNYTWFDFEVQEQRVGDQLLPNSPEHKFNAGLGYRSAKLDAKVSYRWVDEFRWAAGIFIGNVPEYEVINVNANYRFNELFGVGFDISNALDDEHFESFGGDILHRRALGYITINW